MADQNRPVTGYPAPPATNGHPPQPPGTAYAYPAQHQPQPNYFNVSSNPYYTTPYATQQRTTFLRRIFAIFIGCIIITGTIVFIMWLILRPQVPQFRIETLTLTNFTSSNSLITGNWDASFTVRNPNSKITLYYDRIQAAVFYKTESVSETAIPPFVQGKKSETSFKASFASLSAYVDDRNGISSERASGRVNFNIRMVARVRFKAGSWWARRRVLRIFCPTLPMAFSSNSTTGSLIGGPKNCRVGI